MSEFNNMYASRGQGNAGVALGVVGTALSALNSIGGGPLEQRKLEPCRLWQLRR